MPDKDAGTMGGEKAFLKFLTKNLPSYWFVILIYTPCVVRSPQTENKSGPGQKAKVNIKLLENWSRRREKRKIIWITVIINVKYLVKWLTSYKKYNIKIGEKIDRVEQ